MRLFLLRMRWTDVQLLDILDKRVNLLVSRRYSGERVGWRDVLPERIDTVPTGDYILRHTLYRRGT